jgi:hypothetical protein
MGSELGPLVGCLELGNKIPGYKKWGGEISGTALWLLGSQEGPSAAMDTGIKSEFTETRVCMIT